MNAPIIAHILVQATSEISIPFSSIYFKTHICVNHLAAPPHKAREYFFFIKNNLKINHFL